MSDERTLEEVKRQLASAIRRTLFVEEDQERENDRARFSVDAADAVLGLLASQHRNTDL